MLRGLDRRRTRNPTSHVDHDKINSFSSNTSMGLRLAASSVRRSDKKQFVLFARPRTQILRTRKIRHLINIYATEWNIPRRTF